MSYRIRTLFEGTKDGVGLSVALDKQLTTLNEFSRGSSIDIIFNARAHT